LLLHQVLVGWVQMDRRLVALLLHLRRDADVIAVAVGEHEGTDVVERSAEQLQARLELIAIAGDGGIHHRDPGVVGDQVPIDDRGAEADDAVSQLLRLAHPSNGIQVAPRPPGGRRGRCPLAPSP